MITAKTIREALKCENPSCACHSSTGNVHCPAHADSNPSLKLKEKDGNILLKCFGGCSQDRVIAALKEKGLWPSGNGGSHQARKKPLGEPVAVYDYHDAEGQLLFQVCRYRTSTGKTFKQRRPNGSGGWIWNMTGVNRVPYRLPELLKAETVYIPEGEKDVERLASLGLTATTNPGGASEGGGKGKWLSEYNSHFQKRRVIILPDNDPPGKTHARNVARQLHGIAASVKVAFSLACYRQLFSEGAQICVLEDRCSSAWACFSPFLK